MTLITGLGDTEVTESPDTNGFSAVAGGGGILPQRGAKKKVVFVGSSQLNKRLKQ